MITVHKTLKITLGDPTTMNDGDTAMDLLTIHGWSLHSIFRLSDESVRVLLTKEV